MIFQIPVQIEDPLSLWKCSSPNDPSSKVSTYICKCMLDKWLSRQMSNIRWVVFLLCLRDFKDYQCSQLPRPYLYSWLHPQVSGLSVHLSVGSPCGLFGHYLPFQVFNVRPLKSPPSCPTLYQLGLFSLTSDRQRVPSIVFFSQAKNPGTIRFTFPLSARRLWHRALCNVPPSVLISTTPPFLPAAAQMILGQCKLYCALFQNVLTSLHFDYKQMHTMVCAQRCGELSSL